MNEINKTTMITLSELIKSRTYELVRYFIMSDDLNHLTDYDLKNTVRCKNMLELILRAYSYDFQIEDFIDKIAYNTDEIDKYAAFIETLIAHMHYYYEITDFSDHVLHRDFSEFIKPSNDQYVAKSVDQHNALYLITDTQPVLKISQWQAHYITIYNMIIAMGSDADKSDTVDNLNEKCRKFAKHVKFTECENCMQYCPCEFYSYEDANAADAKAVDTEIEGYKKLITKKCDTNVFSMADKTATIKGAKNGYIIAQIDSNTVVLHADFNAYVMSQLENKYPCSENLSDYVIDTVKIVTVNGDERNFAYAGFRYNDVLYKLPNCIYPTMFSYCMWRCDGYTNSIHKSLIDLADKIKQEIMALPEIKYCENATATKDGTAIKITHGPNTIYTDDKIKFRTVAGMCGDKIYQFMKIGKQTYKINELSRYDASMMLMKQRINDAA